jgi:hypothetical protein
MEPLHAPQRFFKNLSAKIPLVATRGIFMSFEKLY